MGIQELASAAYKGLTLKQIAVLIPLESAARNHFNREGRGEDDIDEILRRANIRLSGELLMYFAALAEEVGHCPVAAQWYEGYAWLEKDWSPYREYCVRIGWFTAALKTFESEIEGLKFIIPFLEERLCSPEGSQRTRSLDETNLEIAKRIAQVSKRLARQTATLIMKRAIHQRNWDLMNDCLELLRVR